MTLFLGESFEASLIYGLCFILKFVVDLPTTLKLVLSDIGTGQLNI